MSPAIFKFHRGSAPLLVSIPHMGTVLPDEIRPVLTEEATRVSDTDWHLDVLYGFAQELGASVLQAQVSRYAIDLNRPPDGASLYPGQTTTGLCPTETFRGVPLYRDGATPDAAEIARRRTLYWEPYHQALSSELERLRAQHGRVLLWEAHSIASVLPRLFPDKLPDLNFGTHSGAACDPEITAAVIGALADDGFRRHYSHVLNGRFTGGYITRAYGRPDAGIHAIQLEMCQSTYMDEDFPFAYRPDRAQGIQPWLRLAVGAGLAALRSLPAA